MPPCFFAAAHGHMRKIASAAATLIKQSVYATPAYAESGASYGHARYR